MNTAHKERSAGLKATLSFQLAVAYLFVCGCSSTVKKSPSDGSKVTDQVNVKTQTFRKEKMVMATQNKVSCTTFNCPFARITCVSFFFTTEQKGCIQPAVVMPMLLFKCRETTASSSTVLTSTHDDIHTTR